MVQKYNIHLLAVFACTVLVICEQIDKPVQEGKDISFQCSYDGTYVDFRQQVKSDDNSTKQKTIFLRTSTADGTSSDNLIDQTNRWKVITENSTSSRISLTKLSSRVGDSGIYSCIDAEKKTTTFNISVYARPLGFVDFRSDLSSSNGDEVMIGECTAQDSLPKSIVYWRDQNGKKIDGESQLITTNDKYTTKNVLKIVVDKNAQNTYQCIIEHRGQIQNGSHQNVFSARVNIVWPPSNISIELADTQLYVGDELKLVCKANANPSPTYRWEIKHPNYTQVDQSHWLIKDNIASTSSLKSTDSGLQVRCVAFNNVGEKAEVTVLEISESGLFFAFAPTKVLFSVGLVFSAIFVIFIIVILYRYAKQRKTAVYKTGNVRNNPQQSV